MTRAWSLSWRSSGRVPCGKNHHVSGSHWGQLVPRSLVRWRGAWAGRNGRAHIAGFQENLMKGLKQAPCCSHASFAPTFPGVLARHVCHLLLMPQSISSHPRTQWEHILKDIYLKDNFMPSKKLYKLVKMHILLWGVHKGCSLIIMCCPCHLQVPLGALSWGCHWR